MLRKSIFQEIDVRCEYLCHQRRRRATAQQQAHLELMNSITIIITFISESATMGKQRTAKKLPAKIASRWKDQRLKASGEEAFWAEKEKEKEEKGFKPMIQEPTGRKGKQQQKDKLAVVSSSADTKR